MKAKQLLVAAMLCLGLSLVSTPGAAHRPRAAQSSEMRFFVKSTKANAVAIARQLFAANDSGAKHFASELKVWPNVSATYLQNSDSIAVTFQTKRGTTVRWVNDPTGRYLGTDVYLGQAATQLSGHASKIYFP